MCLWGVGGRSQGGGSTAVHRDKKLWDFCVESEQKKVKKRKQMDMCE